MNCYNFFIFLFSCVTVSAQFHDDNVSRINTIEEAREYASKYREVSFGVVNSESDVVLFDNVDTTNLKASIGQINTIYKRRTKFIKDTSIAMVNIQVIEFNYEKLSLDAANVLIDAFISRYKSGDSYWDLMKEFSGEKCKFTSGPCSLNDLADRFGNVFERKKTHDIFKWSYANKPNLPFLIIIDQKVHSVPAFYSISFNVEG